jgi:hypothetical protein
MPAEIIIINPDKSETRYQSAAQIPDGPLKDEIMKMVSRNPRAHKIVKIIQ